ncbi:MAG: YncE family protein [Myxococcales bacterium]|nr:YncE family protein [Deltaproteobacteria bacterium]NNE19851.1 YncE family protein [Myxococcales bacterium]
MIHRLGWIAFCVLGVAVGGCDSSTGSAGGSGGASGGGGTGGAPRLVVTADWLNQSLTLLDYAKLTDGESDGPSSRLFTIDLSEWEPGPIEVEISPDGTAAVVAVGPAFFDSGVTNTLIGSPEVPPGGTLLIVDLDTGDVTELVTEDVPLGIAISADGALAYTANYGTSDAPGDTLSIIDIAQRRVIQEISLDGRPEQVALSPGGTLGVVNIAGGSGGIHIFETADVEGTLSPLVPTGNDPSDVTFLDDETRVVVANSFSLDVTLVDISDPSAPTVIDSFEMEGGFPYGVTYMPGRDQILAPTGTGSNLVTIDRDADVLIPRLPRMLPGREFPLTAAVDAAETFAFVAHVVDRELSIIDLESGAVRSVSWLAAPGPTYVAVQP